MQTLPDAAGGGLRTLPAPPTAATSIPPGGVPTGPFAPAPPPLDAADPAGAPRPTPFAATLTAKSLEAPGPSVPTNPAAASPPPRPLTLLESLERSPDRSRRLWITQAYWKLAAAAARSRFAAESEERLSLIAPGGNSEELALLDLDTATARAETAAAGVELIAAQQELTDLVRLPVGDPPPWPVDLPLTAAYQTHFETIFAARPATGRVRAIHRHLPLQHAAVVARAEAVAAAEKRFSAMEALHAKGTKPIGAVLNAHDTLVEQEQAFVGALRAYNLDIAEYVMAVADLSVPDDRFAAMLIGQPRPWRQPTAGAPAFGAGVIPASGTVPPPQGFAPLPSGAIPALGIGPQGAVPPAAFPTGGPPRFGG